MRGGVGRTDAFDPVVRGLVLLDGLAEHGVGVQIRLDRVEFDRIADLAFVFDVALDVGLSHDKLDNEVDNDTLGHHGDVV
jgi:hypothetical protein